MATVKLTVDYPLVNEELEPEESAESFIEKTSDEFKDYEVSIEVKDYNMVPTAVFFGLKPRRNMKFRVILSKFPGSDFVHSFLKTAYIEEIVKNEE